MIIGAFSIVIEKDGDYTHITLWDNKTGQEIDDQVMETSKWKDILLNGHCTINFDDKR